MEKETKTYTNEQISKKLVDFCLDKYKFIFICGNGGSGKTTLSKKLVDEINSRGLKANCIDMDDFMIDSKLRKNSQKEWLDAKNNKRVSYHTWAFKESYNLIDLEAIIDSLISAKNTFYKQKKSDKFIEIKAEYPITIIEGVGTAFLEKDSNVYSIFIRCEFDIEINRRIDRARDGENNLSQKEVEEKAIERNEQFEVTILPEKDKFDLELKSLEDYSLIVERDKLSLI